MSGEVGWITVQMSGGYFGLVDSGGIEDLHLGELRKITDDKDPSLSYPRCLSMIRKQGYTVTNQTVYVSVNNLSGYRDRYTIIFTR